MKITALALALFIVVPAFAAAVDHEITLPVVGFVNAPDDLRYRTELEAGGGVVPPDDSPAHVSHARLHSAIARDFGPAELVEPIYVRAPDAEKKSQT